MVVAAKECDKVQEEVYHAGVKSKKKENFFS